MAYSDLSQEDKDTLQTWLNLVRGWAGEQARVNNKGAVIDTMYTAQIQGILAKFDTNEVVPNTSGLAGSMALDVGSEAVTIQSHIQAILSGFNDSGHRQMWVKAAGAANLLGN